MSEYRMYLNKSSKLRPYILGENLEGISVSDKDTPEIGGMIAYDPDNPDEQWYIAKQFFEYRLYRKKSVQPMRPYIPGENLEGISVSAEDTPKLGGMIAHNPDNPEDRWYVGKKFFEENYEAIE